MPGEGCGPPRSCRHAGWVVAAPPSHLPRHERGVGPHQGRRASSRGLKGREIGAQGFGQRPMPWGKKAIPHRGLKGRERGCRGRRGRPALAAFQAAGRWGLRTQGIGLRPHPWAPLSRPVGPVPPCALVAIPGLRPPAPRRHLPRHDRGVGPHQGRRASSLGLKGRQIGAQGFGQRPMPWEKKATLTAA